MMEEMGTDPDEIEGLDLPERRWYDPQEGLDWVSNVCAHLRTNPSLVEEFTRCAGGPRGVSRRA